MKVAHYQNMESYDKLKAQKDAIVERETRAVVLERLVRCVTQSRERIKDAAIRRLKQNSTSSIIHMNHIYETSNSSSIAIAPARPKVRQMAEFLSTVRPESPPNGGVSSCHGISGPRTTVTVAIRCTIAVTMMMSI
jgi:hypothetical protein